MIEPETRIFGRQTILDRIAAARDYLWPLIAGIAVALLALTLLTWNLTNYPKPWFDEGYFIAVAKTVVLSGQYAVPDSGGNWPMDPSITAGPTLILPLAGTFWLFGVGVLQARVFAVLFGILTLGLYTLLAKKVVGLTATWAALLLLLAGAREPLASFVPLARMAMGEVPAFCWLLLGMLLWWRALERSAVRLPLGPLAAAGLAFGLAAVTKPQLLIAIVPTLVLLAIADRWHYRVAPLRAYALPLAVALLTFGSWMGIQLGYGSAVGRATVLSVGVRSNIVGVDLIHIRHALGTLWRSGYLLWGLPGLLYGGWLARQPGRDGLRQAWLLIPTVIVLSWFVLLSVGWPRYAFVPLALTPIWSGALLVQLLRKRTRQQQLALGGAWLAALTLLAAPIVRQIGGPQDQSAELLSAHIRQTLPANAVIETWEWNLEATLSQPMHHPPPLMMFSYIDIMQRNQPPPATSYDPSSGHAEYLIDGPFSSWVQIYAQTIADQGEELARFGPYTLYRLRR